MTEAKKILLVVPPTGRFIRESRCQTPIKDLKTVTLRPPIDLLYCAAGFEQGGAECRLRDYPAEELEWADFERDVAEFKPDLVVLSITTPSLVDDLHAAELAKRASPQTLVCAKGAHFDTHDTVTLEQYPALDSVLRGEFEETARELATADELGDVAGQSFDLIINATAASLAGQVPALPDSVVTPDSSSWREGRTRSRHCFGPACAKLVKAQ